jgi:hypothetical protein|tara:strand:+ start:825 stop:1286 length:462 start_codon:yes stop_codon:yes gene_type:complete
MIISEHFTLEELTRSSIAKRKCIDNQPSEGWEIDNLKLLCTDLLEPIRGNYGVPFSPSSAYRSKDLNKEIGGAPDSQHCLGLAADIQVPGVSNLVLAWWIRTHLDFDQLILEFYDLDAPSSGWVHVSVQFLGNARRHETLVFDGSVFTSGLPG